MREEALNNLPAKLDSRLPQTYVAACSALDQCVRIDECADWADKALALQAYGLQSKDESLYNMALRIRARAIRRAGELLQEIEPRQGARTDLVEGGPRSRAAAAEDAGLSREQRVIALRVASVPKADFERRVESDDPPTIPQLAKSGTKPRPIIHRECNDPEIFSLSTKGQAAIGLLARTIEKVDPSKVAQGASKIERAQLLLQSKHIASWLNRLIRAIRRTR